MLVVMALLGIMMYFGTSMFDYMGRGQKGVRQSGEYSGLLSQIQMALGSPVGCTASLFGATPMATILPALPVPDTSDFFTTPRAITLANGVAVANPSAAGNPETGLKVTALHFEPGSIKEITPTQVVANLLMSVERFPRNTGLGAQNFPDRRIPVQLELDPAGTRQIKSCVSGMSEAKLQPAACQPGSVLVGYNPANANPAVCEPETPCGDDQTITFTGGHWECTVAGAPPEGTVTMCAGGCI
jgi:hypothetical protein